MSPPLRFAFGLHLHQPVGNFDSVFEQHLREVYAPLLREVVGGGCAPVSLHLSGPLLDWLGAHAPHFLDELGRQVADGRVELLLAGYDEPILAAISREDRLEQIGRMHEALRTRFGVAATGLWLTERVWEPDLAGDLHDAGVRYVLVDDRHFLVSGFERAELHRPWRTEHGGRTLDLFPIDQKLRYLVPFRPPAELGEYLRSLRQAGHELAVLADDGEKFGGWPGTREWVYERGWLRDFLATLDTLREAGDLRLVTFSQALDEVPIHGPAYLPSASYHEMEGWSLPVPAARRLAALEKELGPERVQGAEGPLVRGSHWRNFFTKYPESNRLHKRVLALSALSRRRGDSPEVRRHLARAQCNDAYWHGVFGGLYLPHLREALWKELARAEELLRLGEPAEAETLDLDHDGELELYLHSAEAAVVMSPARGGAIEELTRFGDRINYASVLTRRREAYHFEALERGATVAATEGGSASIHDIEKSLALSVLPPVDRDARAILQERVWARLPTAEELIGAEGIPIMSWARTRGAAEIQRMNDGFHVAFHLPGLEKEIRVHADGRLTVRYTWEVRPEWPEGAVFSTELSLSRPLAVDVANAIVIGYPVETLSKSERGFDRTVQGQAILVCWPAPAGTGELEVGRRVE
ncbi:MAG: DUF1925 domain-containing protein [Gemmatimonadales bacterium]|nr:DUF1925 domain-containing protein [Gemmatimonadales bacterium]